MSLTQDPENCHIQEVENQIVFTTTDREVAAMLEKICKDANITDPDSDGGYHYQGWITKEKK